MTEIEQHFASQIELRRQTINEMKLALGQSWLRDIGTVTERIAEIGRINFAIPESALLHWPGKALSHRAMLIEDCVLNTTALETFHAAAIAPSAIVSPERLVVATEFVFNHAEVVRRLPPRLPNPEGADQDQQEHRHEEIGAKLELALGGIDRRLLQLRRNAWSNLAGGVAGARLGMAGIRELFDEVLRIFAPDSEVEAMPVWQDRTDHNITKPTRRMRLAYVLGETRAAEVDALLQFERSIKRTQQFVHTFADDADLVRAQMTHLEIWIYLLVHYGMQRSRSS